MWSVQSARQGTILSGACQNIALWVTVSSTVTWHLYALGGNCDGQDPGLRSKTWGAARTELLVEPEVHLDIHFHRDRLAV